MDEQRDSPVPRFTDLLRAELVRRSMRNPSYSLRAYAKFLDVDPATLSQLLRGRRPCTPRTIRRLGLRLGLDEARLAACEAAEAALASPGDAGANLRRLEELTHDTVEIASDWTHHAILELARAKDFVPDSRRLAATLGLSTDEVNVALQRLLRLGLLEMRGRRWRVRAEPAAGQEAFTAATLIRLHRILGRLIHATGAPSEDPFDEAN